MLKTALQLLGNLFRWCADTKQKLKQNVKQNKTILTIHVVVLCTLKNKVFIVILRVIKLNTRTTIIHTLMVQMWASFSGVRICLPFSQALNGCVGQAVAKYVTKTMDKSTYTETKLNIWHKSM